jgi:hypothetical protein
MNYSIFNVVNIKTLSFTPDGVMYITGEKTTNETVVSLDDLVDLDMRRDCGEYA